MEIFSTFGIKLLHNQHEGGWYFEIYTPDGEELLATGDEFYDSKGTARFAAIGHIHLTEINSKSAHS